VAQANIAVIGAGIGGLALARALARIGAKATLYERRERFAGSGLGLLLLPNGLAALDALGLGPVVRRRSNVIERAVLRQADGTPIFEIGMHEHRGIARGDLLELLQVGVSSDRLRWGAALETLSQSVAGVVARVGGEDIAAELLVGADGVQSTVRRVVAPDWRLTQCAVRELVSVCDAPDIASLNDRKFVKHVHREKRLAVGLLPVASGKIIWYVQFDATMQRPVPTDPEKKREFVWDLVGDWAHPVPELVDRTDFALTHMWRSPGPGPSAPLVTGRVVLVGDAAHPFPTLTSQGANSSLVDAVVLARHLEAGDSIESALAGFASERRPRIEQIREGGMRLVESFLVGGPAELPLVP
jgi:2-polyprenyl-6-methoxyphenol hydroxylase-like FAD-dependent oxidoreductase